MYFLSVTQLILETSIKGKCLLIYNITMFNRFMQSVCVKKWESESVFEKIGE